MRKGKRKLYQESGICVRGYGSCNGRMRGPGKRCVCGGCKHLHKGKETCATGCGIRGRCAESGEVSWRLQKVRGTPWEERHLWKACAGAHGRDREKEKLPACFAGSGAGRCACRLAIFCLRRSALGTGRSAFDVRCSALGTLHSAFSFCFRTTRGRDNRRILPAGRKTGSGRRNRDPFRRHRARTARFPR